MIEPSQLVRLVLALAFLGVMLPAFIFSWQSLSAAVSADGHCYDSRLDESFTYVVDSSGLHHDVAASASVISADECQVVTTPASPKTPGGSVITLVGTSGQDLGPVASLGWVVGRDYGVMARVAQVFMGLAVFLAVVSTLLLCFPDRNELETGDLEPES